MQDFQSTTYPSIFHGLDPAHPPTKLLIIAQAWKGDIDQMKELLRLIYDLQVGPANADILIYPRKDTKLRDPHQFDYLGDKFGLYLGRSKRIIAGWPHGPNALAMDAFKLCYDLWRFGGFNYKCGLLMEADCVPLRPLWIDELLKEWDSQTKLVLGHWDGSGTVIKAPTSHMNGNIMFNPKIVEMVPEMVGNDVPRNGWDMAWWQRMAPYCTPSRLIFSDYRLNTKNNPLPDAERLFRPRFHDNPDNPLYGQELNPCWLHGTKGLKAIKFVREKFLTN